MKTEHKLRSKMKPQTVYRLGRASGACISFSRWPTKALSQSILSCECSTNFILKWNRNETHSGIMWTAPEWLQPLGILEHFLTNLNRTHICIMYKLSNNNKNCRWCFVSIVWQSIIPLISPHFSLCCWSVDTRQYCMCNPLLIFTNVYKFDKQVVTSNNTTKHSDMILNKLKSWLYGQ